MKEVYRDSFYYQVHEAVEYEHDSPGNNSKVAGKCSRFFKSEKAPRHHGDDYEKSLFLKIEDIKNLLLFNIFLVFLKNPALKENNSKDKDFDNLYKLIKSYLDKNGKHICFDDFKRWLKQKNEKKYSETLNRVVLKLKRLELLIRNIKDLKMSLDRLTNRSFSENKRIYQRMKTSKRQSFIISRSLGRYADKIINWVECVLRQEKKVLEKLNLFDIDRVTLRRLIKKIDTQEKRISDLRNELLCLNLRLVVHIANNYRNNGVPFEDLLQEGNIGLMKAIEKFDHGRGYTLSSYALWWIRQSIQRSVAKHGRVIRYPENLLRDISLIKRKNQDMAHFLNRYPSEKELIDNMDFPEEKTRFALDKSRQYIYREYSKDDETHRPLIENLTRDDINDDTTFDNANNNMLERDINGLLENLTQRESDILRMRFGLSGIGTHTLDEIGKKFHLTRERIRLIVINSVNKLRRTNRHKLLRNHL